MDWKQAKAIMGKNFIGPEEISKLSGFFALKVPKRIPSVPFSTATLKRLAKDHLLVLGVSRMKNGKTVTLNNLLILLGTNPKKHEPCFYNQDWYVRQKFADMALKDGWYLIQKEVAKKTRGVQPEKLRKGFHRDEAFPSAVLTAYVFFAYYHLTSGKTLWKHDFVWCSDLDANGDRIYTGRYEDPKRLNANGFNVHRHLSLRPCYGAIKVTKDI
jgi:hypothetical protein